MNYPGVEKGDGQRTRLHCRHVTRESRAEAPRDGRPRARRAQPRGQVLYIIRTPDSLNIYIICTPYTVNTYIIRTPYTLKIYRIRTPYTLNLLLLVYCCQA